MQAAIRYIFTIVLFLSFTDIALAHSKDEKQGRVIQLSGQILHTDHRTSIPGVSIVVKNKDRGTTSNYNGIYSIAIREYDTLVLSAIGLKSRELVIEPDNQISNFKYQDFVMQQDTVYLNAVSIFSLPQGKAFDYAFTQIDTENPMHSFRRNLNPQSLQAMTREMPLQNTEIQQRTQRNMNIERGWDGLQRTGPLMKINGLSDLFRKDKKEEDNRNY